MRNIPVGGGTRKATKRSSTSKRSTSSSSSSPSPSIVTSSAQASVSESDPTQIHVNPVEIGGGSFSSLLSSTERFGNLFEGLNSNGSGLKMVQMGEFGENLNCDPVVNSGHNPNSTLGESDTFLGLQNGDSSCWNGNHGWSDLAIYTPSSSYQ